ncbi:MAG: hypothetical protein IKE76_01295 [Clostridia bacterium]|nr:hypothetical protein [Clostridia bacterium]
MTGVTVTLYEKLQTGTDEFNDPVYELTPVEVANVLVGQPTTDEVTSSIDLYGRKIEYMLGIPKGDTHNWEETAVIIFGEPFRTFGAVIQGIEANIPTPWHRKVRVCRYE